MDQFFANKSFMVCTMRSTSPLLWGYHGLVSLRHRPFRMFQLKGCDYVLIVDYYSRFPEVISLGSTSAQAAILADKSCMACYGIPNVVQTDIGPQFASHEFADFAQAHGFRHETRSPWHPQNNGEVECMVRIVKNLFAKSSDQYLALLSYRDTPGVNGVSPAQLLMGRKL